MPVSRAVHVAMTVNFGPARTHSSTGREPMGACHGIPCVHKSNISDTNPRSSMSGWGDWRGTRRCPEVGDNPFLDLGAGDNERVQFWEITQAVAVSVCFSACMFYFNIKL